MDYEAIRKTEVYSVQFYAAAVVPTDQSTIMLDDLHAHTLVVEGQLLPNRGVTGFLTSLSFLFFAKFS